MKKTTHEKNKTVRAVRAEDKTVRELMGDKYSVDNYQREYKWETKQVGELIDDLWSAFDAHYEESHSLPDVEYYGGYFLGSVVVSGRNIVDGQQRLTTLTLILMHIRPRCKNDGLRASIASLICSDKFGKQSFNIDVAERKECMDALYNGERKGEFKSDEYSESVRNLAKRYDDIVAKLEDRSDELLQMFAQWLIEHVRLVKIAADTDSNAYEIFETMNDRGLRLTPTEMLKNFLLSKVSDRKRDSIAEQWRKSIDELVVRGKEEDSDAIKAWLRAQYAKTQRDRSKGADPKDFENIGTQFHRWVREHSKKIGLESPNDFESIVERDMKFYLREYRKLREASAKFSENSRYVYYNAEHDFTLQYPVLLAVLSPGDDEASISRKVRWVSQYLDIRLHRRIFNWESVTRSTMEYNMWLLIKAIRGSSEKDLPDILHRQFAKEKFSIPPNFGLRRNKEKVRRILARMTDYVAVGSGIESRYTEYVRLEIEHIWADHPERFVKEFPTEHDFREYRDRIGGLLLLPKPVNASCGDGDYDEKRKHYLKENPLAQSLHPDCYKKNPRFLRFKKDKNLSFKPHEQFAKRDLDERHELYVQIAGQIWNPDNLLSGSD